MSDTKISDTKPKRAAREPAHNQVTLGQAALSQAAPDETAVAEAVAATTAALIERNIGPEPEQVSTIALTQAVPVGPACPVPAAPERSAAGKAPTSDKPTLHEAPEAAAETAWTAFAEAQSAL